MGIDAGSDMVPRLSTREFNRKTWQSFIDLIKNIYKNDDLVEVKPNHICFNVGEHSRLPLEGHIFYVSAQKFQVVMPRA
jgi:hypothetical protein